jgi:hypothetical protein
MSRRDKLRVWLALAINRLSLRVLGALADTMADDTPQPAKDTASRWTCGIGQPRAPEPHADGWSLQWFWRDGWGRTYITLREEIRP